MKTTSTPLATGTLRSEHRLRSNPLLAMRPDERERFLADVHVGIVAHDTATSAAPLASPVWYSYEPGGDVVFVTAGTSLKALHLAATGTATFLVQDERPPQRFVASGIAPTPGSVVEELYP